MTVDNYGWPILNNTDFKPIQRVSIPELNSIIGTPFQVLDHGFIRLIDYMGDDSSIVQAARVSYGKGTKMLNEDRGLIRYLLRHQHTTPFEMLEIKFHMKMPLFIARQFVRHRMASINEYSGRYSVMDKDFYAPQREQLAAQSTVNKQGRESVLQGEEADRALEIINQDSKLAYDHYLELLNQDDCGEIIHPDKQGLARELARMNLPVNYYTQWYWKIDLKNLLHFLRLRADSHAQWEIQEYARCMMMIVEKWVPDTIEAWHDYQVNGKHLSHMETTLLKNIVSGQLSIEDIKQSPKTYAQMYDMSMREMNTFIQEFGNAD